MMLGEIKNLPINDYHKNGAIGSTSLKYATKSLAQFKAKMDGLIPEKETSYFDLGKAAHHAVLEQSFDRYVKGPEVSSKAVKAWKDFSENAKANNKIPLTPDEYEQVKGMYEAFFNHPKAPKLIAHGRPEVSYFHQDKERDLYLKARPDYFVQDNSNGSFVVDYKTTQSALPQDFSRSLFNYGYDLSAAFYLRVIEQVIGLKDLEFFWIAQEKTAPYELQIFNADSELLKRSKEKVERLLLKISMAKKTNHWPGYSPEIQIIDVPYWALNQEALVESTDEIA